MSQTFRYNPTVKPEAQVIRGEIGLIGAVLARAISDAEGGGRADDVDGDHTSGGRYIRKARLMRDARNWLRGKEWVEWYIAVGGNAKAFRERLRRLYPWAAPDWDDDKDASPEVLERIARARAQSRAAEGRRDGHAKEDEEGGKGTTDMGALVASLVDQT